MTPTHGIRRAAAMMILGGAAQLWGQSPFLYDVNGDGIPDEVVQAGTDDFNYSINWWWTSDPGAGNLVVNSYWAGINVFNPDRQVWWSNFTITWQGGSYFNPYYQTNFGVTLNFRPRPDRPMSIFMDPTGSSTADRSVWMPMQQNMGPMSVASISYSQPFSTVGSLDGTTFYMAHLASSSTISGLSLSTGTGWEFVPSAQYRSAYTFYNFGADTVTMRARDAWGNIAGGSVQWHITDLINDVVTHNWVTQPSVTFGDLATHKAWLVRSRMSGSSPEFAMVLKFAEGAYGYGAGGDPNKVFVSDTYPYRQERKGSCSIGCLRNVLSIKGKQVPTEDAIIQILVQNGKSAADFLDVTIAMKDSESTQRFNQVLNPSGLIATRLNSITLDALTAKVNNGSVFIVGIKLGTGERNGVPLLKQPGHMIVIRKVGNKIEVLDPSDGKTTYSIDDGLKKDIGILWGGSPPQTSKVWEIESTP